MIPSLILFALGCSSSPVGPVERTPEGSGDGSSPSGEDSGGSGACALYGMSEFEQRTLPPLPGIGPWRLSSDGLCSDDGEQLYRLEDADGDGYDDIIIVRDCAKADGTGDDHWVVFRGGADGWSETPTRWTLPAPRAPYGWVLFASRSCEGVNQTVHDIIDVTGDGRNDLVIYDACDETSSVGRGQWVVHAGAEDGYAMEGEAWEVSRAEGASAFTERSRRSCDGGATPRYELIDVQGDGLRDLLLTGDCGANEGLGTDHWMLYPGTGSGFQLDAPVRLELPSLGAELPLIGSRRCDRPSDVIYEFSDHDQDGDRDLLVSGFCDGRADPGMTRWDVYAFEDGAFNPEPGVYEMPDVGVAAAWIRTFSRRCTAQQPVVNSFWDVNGDGYSDPIIREMCTPDAPTGLGTDHYRLWLRNPDLSLGAEQRFELPVDPEGTLWLDMLDDFCGHVGDALVTVSDLDGDRTPEGLMTYACDPDAAVGWTEWRMSEGGCLDGRR